MVLAIDDAPEVHALLGARLKPEGVRLVSALGWREGLDLAISESPDLILLDVEMPGQNGLDLCRALKADPRTSAIPIIFLTGSTDVNTKVHGFDLGAIDYVTKPFHPAELRARVRSALRTKRYQDLLTARAQVDALTSLHNRGYFDAFIESSMASSMTTGHPLSLVMMDIDHFKRLNDRYGHPFGDLVLQRVGEHVGSLVRAGDAVCRYGGEEVAFIFPGLTSSIAATVAERIRQSLASFELTPRGERVTVTASFGVAEAREVAGFGHGMTAAALVAAADGALYEAKHQGRDRVCVAHAKTLGRSLPPMHPQRSLPPPQRTLTTPPTASILAA
jgi:two-component system cell cycle response regulator